MKEYRRRLDEAGGVVSIAERKLFAELDGGLESLEARHRGTAMQNTSPAPSERYEVSTKV